MTGRESKHSGAFAELLSLMETSEAAFDQSGIEMSVKRFNRISDGPEFGPNGRFFAGNGGFPELQRRLSAMPDLAGWVG